MKIVSYPKHTNIYKLIAVVDKTEKVLMQHESFTLSEAKKYFAKVYTGTFIIGYWTTGKATYQTKQVVL